MKMFSDREHNFNGFKHLTLSLFVVNTKFSIVTKVVCNDVVNL